MLVRFWREEPLSYYFVIALARLWREERSDAAISYHPSLRVPMFHRDAAIFHHPSLREAVGDEAILGLTAT